MTDLSLPTLQFSVCLVFGTCAAIFLCNWLLSRGRLHLLCMSVSFAIFATMAAWASELSRAVSVLSPLGWSLGMTAFWIGFRIFDGQRPVTVPMIAAFAFPSAIHLALALTGRDHCAVITGGTLAVATYYAGVGLSIVGPSDSRSPLRWVIAGSLFAIAAAVCLPLLPMDRAALQLSVVGIYVIDHIIALLLTTSILALEAEKAHAAVEVMARTDALTGALNRQGLAAKTASGLEEAGVIVADLDHFKAINDRFGHAAGDAVLRAFAERAGGLLSEGSHLARLGGEEFGIVLPRRDPDATKWLAERLRSAIEGTPVPWKEMAIPITVSIGVAMLKADEALNDAIDRADMALYDAKTEGRNRVRLASCPPLVPLSSSI